MFGSEVLLDREDAVKVARCVPEAMVEMEVGGDPSFLRREGLEERPTLLCQGSFIYLQILGHNHFFHS